MTHPVIERARSNLVTEREALIVAAILPQARRVNASVFELEAAVAIGIEAIACGRSRGFAIALARQHLPRKARVDTHANTAH